MVLFMLKIMAHLKDITNLQPQGGCNEPNCTYLFKLKCEGCRELTEKETGVRLNINKSKGAPYVAQKCKFCEREGSVTMIPEYRKPETRSGVYCPLMMFECNGFEPVDFIFSGAVEG